MKTKKLNIYSTKVVLFLLLLAGFALSARAQVTIGSQLPPLKGAILDLKEWDAPDGSQSSTGGLMMARVYLNYIDSLSPILTGADAANPSLMPQYTGLIVYNVNPTLPLTKGLYSWNGTQWVPMNTSAQGGSGVHADNGLSLSLDTIQLGGDLIKNTTIDLQNNHLTFNAAGQGKVGVSVAQPAAFLDINSQTGVDPLILNNTALTSAANAIDGAGATYNQLQVSDSGVVREVVATPVNPNAAYVYNLNAGSTGITVADGDSLGNNGSPLTWTLGGANATITLPSTGTFIFAFRFYGSIGIWTSAPYTHNKSASFYLSAFKNSSLFYAEELIVHVRLFADCNPNLTYAYDAVTYSATVSVSGNAGDAITFKLGRKADSTSYPMPWKLESTTGTQANTTSMVFWKQ